MCALIKPKVKVLAVYSHMGIRVLGGVERILITDIKHLTNLGVSVYVLENKPLLKDIWPNVNYQSFTIENNFFKFPLGRIFLTIYLCLIGFFLGRRLNCDVVYVPRHDLYENIISGYVISRVLKKPLVILFFHLKSGERMRLDTLLRIMLSEGISPLAAILHTILDLFKRLIYRKAEAHIALSDATARDVVEHFKVAHSFVIGGGVDAIFYETTNSGHKPYDAVFLGRISQLKGADALLRIWKIVLEEIPDAKLLMIGDGESTFLNEYKTMIAKLNLETNVTITGFISNDSSIAKLLNLCKVFTFPSRVEGFALAVAEAMACGLPCVISDIPALRENYGKVAILIKPHDIEGFAKTIINLLKNGSMREEIGKKAKEYVKKFSWEEVAKKKLKLLENLLSKRYH